MLPTAITNLQAADVYMIAHVPDDVGQAVVAAALEDAGLLGHHPTQLPPQRLLFCSTQQGARTGSTRSVLRGVLGLKGVGMLRGWLGSQHARLHGPILGSVPAGWLCG